MVHVLMPGAICRIVMIGGGYIACEQACIYTKFGAEVHFLIRGVCPLHNDPCDGLRACVPGQC